MDNKSNGTFRSSTIFTIIIGLIVLAKAWDKSIFPFYKKSTVIVKDGLLNSLIGFSIAIAISIFFALFCLITWFFIVFFIGAFLYQHGFNLENVLFIVMSIQLGIIMFLATVWIMRFSHK